MRNDTRPYRYHLAAALVTAFLFPLPAAAGKPGLEAKFPQPRERTLVVSPVSGSPKKSGKALLRALKTAEVSQGRTQTQDVTIRLEPGVYDIGKAALHMVAGVDVIGSGSDETEIVGLGQSFHSPTFSFARGVVVGASDAELRDLTVRCTNTPELDACITVANLRASPRLHRVRLLATSPTGGHWGLRNIDSAPRMREVEIVTANGSNNYGLVNDLGGSRPEILHTTITAADGSGDNVGILNKREGLPTRLVDVEIGVMNGSRAIGVLTLVPGDFAVTRRKSRELLTLRLQDVEIAALDAAENFGFLHGSYTLEMRQSRVLSDDSAIDIGALGDIDVAASELRAGKYFAHGVNVKIAGSTLLGGGWVVAYGDAECTDVHTEAGAVDGCP